MSARSTPPILPGELPPAEALSSLARLRDSTGDFLFQVSRAFPKLLTLRSTPRAWTLFRVLLGAAGASLVVLPLSLWQAWAFAPVGLCMFLLAVLLPPLRQDRGAAQTIEQLGAYRVIDGGRLAAPGEDLSDVHFYLTPTRVWALDEQLRPLAIIPVADITMATAFPSQSDWVLRVSWKSEAAEFIFDGLFAERRVRIAEAGLRQLIQPTDPPTRARARAAGA